MILRIESGTRWDALALTRKLARYRWFLVEPDFEHWDVYVPLDEQRGDELPADLQQRLAEWLNERDLRSATVHTGAADFVFSRQ
jgi:hypothetical protein